MKKTVQLMDEKIHRLPPLPAEPCIFKVHEELRRVNKKAYTPTLVSIGPYHHGNPKLHAMEQHKLRYLRSFLQRNNDNDNNYYYYNDTISVEPYLLLMEELEDEARGCYADRIHLKSEEFVEMMLVDACFIIELLHKCLFKEQRDKDDPIFRSSWMEMQIYRDLILLENQLPFFILSKLLAMTSNPDFKYRPLMVMAIFPIFPMLPSCKDSVIEIIAQLARTEPASESKHFLDLVHNIYLPLYGKDFDSNTTSKSNSSGHQYCDQMSCVTELQESGISFKVDDNDDKSNSSGHQYCDQMPCVTKLQEASISFKVDDNDDKSNSSGNQYCDQMSCVTELQEAGISFKVDDNDDVSIFDIVFQHGHMKIPKFKVQDRTETFLRNIIAYEQHSSSVDIKYFTDYQYFMDLLINTEKDVNTLRLHGIIENMLGDDSEVARMFNKLGDGVIIESNFYYSQICQEVNKHCGKCWNRAKAKLRHNYFHNPWVSISTSAAAVLLLLTLTQTVVALIDLLLA